MAIFFHAEGWPAEEWLAAFNALAPEREVCTLDNPGDPEEVEYALVWKPPAGALERFANLKLIVSAGAGVDHLLNLPSLPDVPISRVVDPDLTQRMSEYIVQQALMHLRRQRDFDACQRRKDWCEHIVPPTASEVSVGILGLGALGRDAARKLQAMGFPVAGWSRTKKDVKGVECFAGEAELAPFLARTDILICLLPLTPLTRGILDRDLFSRLKQDGPLGGPVLINAGRGQLQREADILDALEAGTLKAASLDVFEMEPLPESSPLWDHPAVTITPHIAAVSSPRAIVAYALRQVARMETGKPVENPVDRQRGY